MTKLLKSLWFILYAPLLVLKSRVKWDIIYCDDSFPYYPAIIKLISPKSKVIHYLGDFHLMYYFKGLIYKVLHYFEILSWKMVDRIWAITPVMRAKIWQESGLIAPTIAESVDEGDFLLEPPRSPFTSDFSNKTYQIVMFHGLVSPQKGLDVFLDVAKEFPNVIFKIVGSGPALTGLKEKAPPNVVFMGWIPFQEVKEHIASCTIGIAMRSNDESNQFNFTMAFLQYGIMKKPVIVPMKQSYKDIGYSAYAYVNKQQLILHLKFLLENEELRKKIGEEIYRYVKTYHEAQKIAQDRHDELFR